MKPEDAYKIWWYAAYTNNYKDSYCGHLVKDPEIISKQAWYAAVNYCEQENQKLRERIAKLEKVREAAEKYRDIEDKHSHGQNESVFRRVESAGNSLDRALEAAGSGE